MTKVCLLVLSLVLAGCAPRNIETEDWFVEREQMAMKAQKDCLASGGIFYIKRTPRGVVDETSCQIYGGRQ